MEYILDSKYYRFGYTGKEEDLPGTASIQKQITYGDYIKNNMEKFQIRETYNAFIMPYNRCAGPFKSNENIQYVGFAIPSWKDNTHNHNVIHTFLIDLRYVVYTWSVNNHGNDIHYLIDEIMLHQEEAKAFI